jgi:hypothetical protein
MTINQQEADAILKALRELRLARIGAGLDVHCIGNLYFKLAERYANCGYDCANLQKRPTINHNETDRKTTPGPVAVMANRRRRTTKRSARGTPGQQGDKGRRTGRHGNRKLRGKT